MSRLSTLAPSSEDTSTESDTPMVGQPTPGSVEIGERQLAGADDAEGSLEPGTTTILRRRELLDDFPHAM